MGSGMRGESFVDELLVDANDLDGDLGLSREQLEGLDDGGSRRRGVVQAEPSA